MHLWTYQHIDEERFGDWNIHTPECSGDYKSFFLGDVDEQAHILQKTLLVYFLSQVSYLVEHPHPYLGIKPHGNNHNDALHHNHPKQFFVVHGIR